jgi:hypothetical protein
MLICPHCRRHASALTGTIFHRTRTPLRTWLLAAWEITSRQYGASALGLQRTLGLGSYQTAWAWLHKFRRAMVHPGHDRLSGWIEAGESCVGSDASRGLGRPIAKRATVAIAVEANRGKIGRARLRYLPGLSSSSLTGFLTDVVLPGSTICTKGRRGYEGLASRGFDHKVAALSTSPDTARTLLPSVHQVALLLNRWILGTLQGGIARQHLPYYLDEFTFRLNHRSSRARGLLFYHLLEQAVRCGYTPTARLYQNTGRGPRPSEARALH